MMRLEKLRYSEYEAQPEEWVFDDCTFGNINLIVGKNATGKSRTLRIIRGLAAHFSEYDILRYRDGKYAAEFSHDNDLYSYTIEHHDNTVFHEELTINDVSFLSRGSDGSGTIFAQQLGQKIQFKTQKDRIALVAKRDSIQHPFIEHLYNWGKGVALLEFGSALGRNQVLVKTKDVNAQDSETKLSIKDTEKVVGIFLQGEEEFGQRFRDAVISDMKIIGYDIEDIGVDALNGVSIVTAPLSPPPTGIYVKETDLESRVLQINISQGMFRALSLFTQINYSLLSSQATCLLIDDIGEGLDFSRSSALVKLVIEKVKNSSVQLIMATNDRLIMNAVPLEYWLILIRTKGKIVNMTYRNSKEMFDKFQDLGLNNFDLFSSEYYKNK